VEVPGINFYVSLSSGNRVVPCGQVDVEMGRQTARQRYRQVDVQT